MTKVEASLMFVNGKSEQSKFDLIEFLRLLVYSAVQVVILGVLGFKISVLFTPPFLASLPGQRTNSLS